MKPNEWNEGMNHLDSDLVEEYIAQKDAYTQKKKSKKGYWIAAVAAILVLAICIGMLAGGNGVPGVTTGPEQMETDPTNGQTDDPATNSFVNLLAAPVYPEMVKKPNLMDYQDNWGAYSAADQAWRENKEQQYNQPDGYADSLTDFFYASMAQFLQGDGNPTYSPLNVYMAMAMLAETTGGNSRQQILDLLGMETIEQLREQASYVWNAHYNDDGETTLLMANSMWLDEDYTFHKDTSERLANYYFASSFRGDLGTEDMDKQLQTWLDINTGGLLKDQAQNIKLDPMTVFALASAVYFSAGWEEEFSEGKTKDAVFHAQTGDWMTPFMNQTFTQYTYFWGENFGAISLELTGSNRMWLILPDAGCTTADILASDDYLRMTLDPNSWENKSTYKINLSLPKFDVVNQIDLIDGMKAMGVTDIFDDTISDFTPVTDTPMLYVNQIHPAARVSIDGEGCIAAAFTVILAGQEGVPPELEELDFILDRSFLFVVSSRDNLPLFAGVVNEP